MVGAETLAAGGVAVVVGAEDEAGAVQATASHMTFLPSQQLPMQLLVTMQPS